MRKDIAMAWVKDLRENAEKQGKEALFDGERYCCLGRLCVVLGADFVKEDGQFYPKKHEEFFDSPAVLPVEFAQHSKMKSRNPKVVVAGPPDFGTILPTVALAELNDFGVPFSTIAELIEDQWESL